MASASPSTSEIAVSIFMGSTRSFAAAFFSRSVGSAKSPYTSAERMSMPMPSMSCETRFTTPRTKGSLKKTLLSDSGRNLLDSTVIEPVSVRTAVATVVALFIMTPSSTACPPMVVRLTAQPPAERTETRAEPSPPSGRLLSSGIAAGETASSALSLKTFSSFSSMRIFRR